MENNKKIELSTSQIIIIILCSGIISIILFFSGFFIINPIMKNDTEVARVNENITLEKQKVDKLKDIADIISKPPVIPTPTPTPTMSQTPPPTSTPYNNSYGESVYYDDLMTIQEYYKDQNLQKSEPFVVSYVEEDSDGYILYTHTLEDKPKSLSEDEINILSNGGIIKFRGCNWFSIRKNRIIK